MSRTIEEVSDACQLASYADDWRDLAERSTQAELFLTYEWITTWLECFWKNRPIRFLFVRENGKLTALLPLLDAEGGGKIGCSLTRTLSLPVNGHARRSDLLYVGAVGELLDDIVTYLAQNRNPLKLHLHLRADSPLVVETQHLVRNHGLCLYLHEGYSNCPVVRMDSNWNDYFGSLPRKVRHEMQRKARRLEGEGKVELEVLGSLEDCDRALPEVFRIEAASWKQAEGSSLTADPEVRGRLYSDVARRAAASGWLRVYLLLLDGTPIAHILGVVYKHEYNALITAYDVSLAGLSPGSVIFFYALRDSFEQGFKSFDLLGEETRWKREIASDQRDLVILCLHSKNAFRCRWHTALEENLKPWVKQHAPGLVKARRWLQQRV